MSGRAATVNIIPGRYALSVGRADMPTPPGWSWAPLTDIARLESGHTPSREYPEYWDGEIAWIGIRDARQHHGGVIHETTQTVTQAGIDNSAARLLPAQTVCLSRTASIGYVVVMGREMATSQDFVNWICGPTLDPGFLQQLFIAENESLFRFSKGSTHSTIYYPEVKAFHVCLPPLNEQRRIVGKLEALQSRSRRAREALDTIPPLLEKLRQSILAAAFRGDLTKDWREKHPDVEPASELLKRIRVERRKKWEEAELAKMKAKGKLPGDDRWKAKYKEPEPVDATGLPELPDGWCWASVEESALVGSGLTKNAGKRAGGADVPLVSVAAVQLRRIDIDQVSSIQLGPEDGDKGELRAGDLLIVEGNGSLTHIGRVALWNDEISGARHQNHLIRVRPVLVSPSYTLEWLASPLGRGAIVEQATSAAGLYTLSLSKVDALPIPLAPLDEQTQMMRIVENAVAGVRSLEGCSSTIDSALAQLNRSIRAKAFRGELVPQDPSDEPAAVMLERVKAESRGGRGKSGRGRSGAAARRGRR